MAFPQGNRILRPTRGRNPMNLTIDTSGDTLAGANNNNKSSSNLRNDSNKGLQPLPQQNNRFPLNSPITAEIPSPEHSSGSETGSKPTPKLVNPGLAGDAAGEGLDLHADSALSKTQLERKLRERLEQRSKTTTTRDMASATQQQQQQQRPAGLQLMTEFGREDVQSEKGTFLDLSDLKSIANAREKERLREYNSSSQSLQQPVQDRGEGLSPSDRPIMIGLTVPFDESTPRSTAAAAGETIDSASSRTPATPSIVVTPAREHPPWHTDMHLDMSTSPEMLHRPRAASSIYSQPSPKPMYDEDAPPVPAIPAFHSVTSFQRAIYDQRPASMDTEFEGEEQVSSQEKELSPTTTRKNMKRKLLHKLSVNTSDANRPDSQGWWTYLLSPLLSRSNTVSSRRTALSPQQHQTRSARSPLSAVSFSKALSPPQPTTATAEEGESSHWWDDEKIAIPPEKSHFSPDTPEDMTRHVAPIAWDMPFLNEHITTIKPNPTTTAKALPEGEKAEKTRSVFQIGDQMVPNYEFHGSRAEYYQASAHDLHDKENPYFECINHVCSMTSAKRRAEIEAAEKEAEERLMAEAENGKGGLAVFVFDSSRDANNPFIAFVEKRVDAKEVEVGGDGDEKSKEGGDEKEVEGEEVEKTGLSNARELLSFDSSDEDEDAPADPEKGRTRSRGLSHSPDLKPTARSVESFSPPPRSRYEPSVSLSPPVEERGIAPPPPAPASVSYSRGMSPPPAPAPVSAPAPTYIPPAPAPAPLPAPVAAPPPVQMPMMPPPQPRAFSPEPVPMPMPPPPQSRGFSPEPVPMPMHPPSQPRAFSPEPVAMPMPPPAPVPAPAPPAPREPVPMPMSRSPPVDERAQVAMPPPPQPPSDNARGIPGDYQWEPVPVPRTMSPPRPTRVTSPPMPPTAPVPMAQSREVEDSATRPGLESERNAEPAIARPAPSFSRPGPFSAPRRVPQPPPAPSHQTASDAPADESDAESVLPPYSRNAPRQPGLPTYTARDQSEERDRAPAAPGPVSPGLQQAMTSRGGIPMSDVSQRTRDMDFNDAGSISRPVESRTVINVHHFYNGEHPRDAPEPPRLGNQFVSEADLQSREENEARRQRLEKEDKIAKKVGGFWRGRGCIPEKGCFGRGGREGRTRRRWYAAIIAFCILVIVLSISLATTLTRKGDRMSVESEWLNITGFPPIPTGIMTVAGPAPAVERSSCIAPTSLWSCALPPEQQASNAGGYAPDAPNFRIEIRFRNDSSLMPNSTASNSTASKRSWGGIFRRDDWTASPAAPRLIDQTFLGNTTDNITTPFQGEDTPFYITFLSPVDVANASAEYVKRDVVSSTATATGTGTGTGFTTTVTHPATGTGAAASHTGTQTNIKAASVTQTQTGTSTATSTSTPEIDVGKLIPAPDLASDGTAAAATLYPLPVQQPIKLYNRGLPTEHYGFFTFFDKSIFLASDASITGSSTDTDSRDANGGSTETEASVRCTWSQTRFLVQIWTQPQNVSHMSLSSISNTTATNTSSSSTASAASSTATSKSSSGSVATSSANNFTSPGSFPYPITITIDRHGGIATEKLAYCYGIQHNNSSSSSSSSSSTSTVTGPYYNLTNPKLQPEERNSGGSIVQPSPDYFVLAAALASGVTADEENPVDGGTGGCMCEWRNWVETH